MYTKESVLDTLLETIQAEGMVGKRDEGIGGVTMVTVNTENSVVWFMFNETLRVRTEGCSMAIRYADIQRIGAMWEEEYRKRVFYIILELVNGTTQILRLVK